MSKIVLKTADRGSTISRQAVREAVAAVVVHLNAAGRISLNGATRSGSKVAKKAAKKAAKKSA